MLRRTKVPDAVRALAPEERRLAWGVASDGTPLVATATSLYAGSRQLPWTSVEKVVWRPPALTVTEVSDVEGTGTSHAWEVAQDHRLAETIHSQVTSSVAWSDRRALQPRGHVRLVGRRVPGQDRLLWQTVWEAGTDRNDPSLRAQTEQQLEGLRKTIG
jgi:hypothetical protein